MSDRLSALLQRFELRAQVFHGGPLCGLARFDEQQGVGHLHLLRQGAVVVTDARGTATQLDAPSVLFFPRPHTHQLQPLGADGAELVCASVDFGSGDSNPLLRALPTCLVVPLERLLGLNLTQQLLFEEAFRPRCGHDAVVNRLTEVLLIQVLRHAIEQRLVDGGLMAGLADPRLHKALVAMHEEPSRHWTLDALAAQAGMSRARFAAHFSRCVGTPPGEYLASWRIGLARTLLRRGVPVKQVAAEVGYANASALGRAFTQRVGSPPATWVAQHAVPLHRMVQS